MIIIILTMLNQQSFHLILQVILIDNDKWTTLAVATVAVVARPGEGLCVLRRRHMSILTGVVMGIYISGRHDYAVVVMAPMYT
jgi:hypothetical protein